MQELKSNTRHQLYFKSTSTYIKELVCVRPSRILLARRTQGNGYHSMSGVSLSVWFVCEENRVPQCNG